MQVDTYFDRISSLITEHPIIQTYDIEYDKRGSYEGLIRATLYLHDSSTLHVREFVDVETDVDRLMYVYHYMAADESFIFRYDNSGHYKHLNLSTHPHHKHIGQHDPVELSAPTLAEVLDEIEESIQL